MRRWLVQRRRVALGMTMALALFVAFEVSVRLVTPDAVRYQIVTINPVGPGSTRSGTITDPATVMRWRAAMTAQPVERLSDAYFTAWWGNGCSYGTVEVATARFTWHGLPVETVSPGPGCAGGTILSSGGLPSLQTYLVDFDALPRS